jgi:uncharacterized heparinase superfamily protein
MTVPMFHKIKTTTRNIACGSFVYDWRLRGHTPDALVVKPVDPWAGDSENGHTLCAEGSFAIDGDRLTLRGECWEPVGVDAAWLDHMHGFTWLRDLRALGGDSARHAARAMIASWIRHYEGWHKMAWRPDIAGERIALWIAHYDFFGAGGDEFFQDQFFESLVRQARHVRRSLPGDTHGLAALKTIKGLLYAGVAFEGYELWIEHALEQLETEIARQILSDGSHASRSPQQLLLALQILLDIRGALTAAGYPAPDYLQHAIDRAGPAVRFFRYGDKHFGLFNGAQENDASFIDAVLAQASAGSRPLSSLPSAGFERVTLGRTLLLMDSGKVPTYPHDQSAHAAPLSFELCYGKERIFVNCGSHPSSADWQDSLRATAAHNTLSIDHRNACEIRGDGHFARKVKVSSSLREETKSACLLEATHDGYMAINGMTHRRRLFLTDQGHDLRGEDILNASVVPTHPLQVAIRFHIHPRVLVSLVQDSAEALLRLPTGIGWRFHQCGGVLALEDSVYLGQGGRPRKTRQLVVYTDVTTEHASIRWALQREGL